MDIQATSISRATTAQATPVAMKNWLVGKLLNASVIERRPDNSVLLKLQDQLVEAKSRQPLNIRTGDNLVLRVIQNNNPMLLKIEPQQRPPNELQLQQQLLRETLPRQAGLNKLNTVFQIANNKSQAVLESLPMPVKKYLQKIVDTLPTPRSLETVSGLKSALRDSGLFLETKLLNAVRPNASALANMQTLLPGNDLKANLLQLYRVIKKTSPRFPPATSLANTKASSPIPVNTAVISERLSSQQPTGASMTGGADRPSQPALSNAGLASTAQAKHFELEQIGKQVESAVARIETNQARAITTETQPLSAWRFELPVKDDNELDLVKLELEQEQHAATDEQDANAWTVNLDIEFEHGGSLSARASMYGSEMHVALWSTDGEIDALIEKHMNKLNNNLLQKGLQLKALQHVQHSQSQQESAMPETQLISVKL